METNKEIDAVNEKIKNIVKPIFLAALNEGSPQEMPQTHMMGRGLGDTTTKYIIYYPHNYRLYFDFDRSKLHKYKINLKPEEASDCPKPIPTRLVCGQIKPLNIRNQSELHLKDFKECNIRIKRTSIEIRNFINQDKKFRIPLDIGTMDRMIKIDKEKIDQSIMILKSFIGIYGGSSNFSLLRIWHENKYWHEAFIDSLPRSMRWHTEHSKKVYDLNTPSNIELWDNAKAANFVDGLAINNQSPILKSMLEELNAKVELINRSNDLIINKLNPSIDALTAQIDTHLEVQHSTLRLQGESLKTQKMMQNSLSYLIPRTKSHQKRRYGLSDKELDKIRNMNI